MAQETRNTESGAALATSGFQLPNYLTPAEKSWILNTLEYHRVFRGQYHTPETTASSWLLSLERRIRALNDGTAQVESAPPYRVVYGAGIDDDGAKGLDTALAVVGAARTIHTEYHRQIPNGKFFENMDKNMGVLTEGYETFLTTPPIVEPLARDDEEERASVLEDVQERAPESVSPSTTKEFSIDDHLTQEDIRWVRAALAHHQNIKELLPASSATPWLLGLEKRFAALTEQRCTLSPTPPHQIEFPSDITADGVKDLTTAMDIVTAAKTLRETFRPLVGENNMYTLQNPEKSMMYLERAANAYHTLPKATLSNDTPSPTQDQPPAMTRDPSRPFTLSDHLSLEEGRWIDDYIDQHTTGIASRTMAPESQQWLQALGSRLYLMKKGKVELTTTPPYHARFGKTHDYEDYQFVDELSTALDVVAASKALKQAYEKEFGEMPIKDTDRHASTRNLESSISEYRGSNQSFAPLVKSHRERTEGAEGFVLEDHLTPDEVKWTLDYLGRYYEQGLTADSKLNPATDRWIMGVFDRLELLNSGLARSTTTPPYHTRYRDVIDYDGVEGLSTALDVVAASKALKRAYEKEHGDTPIEQIDRETLLPHLETTVTDYRAKAIEHTTWHTMEEYGAALRAKEPEVARTDNTPTTTPDPNRPFTLSDHLGSKERDEIRAKVQAYCATKSPTNSARIWLQAFDDQLAAIESGSVTIERTPPFLTSNAERVPHNLHTAAHLLTIAEVALRSAPDDMDALGELYEDYGREPRDPKAHIIKKLGDTTQTATPPRDVFLSYKTPTGDEHFLFKRSWGDAINAFTYEHHANGVLVKETPVMNEVVAAYTWADGVGFDLNEYMKARLKDPDMVSALVGRGKQKAINEGIPAESPGSDLSHAEEFLFDHHNPKKGGQPIDFNLIRAVTKEHESSRHPVTPTVETATPHAPTEEEMAAHERNVESPSRLRELQDTLETLRGFMPLTTGLLRSFCEDQFGRAIPLGKDFTTKVAEAFHTSENPDLHIERAHRALNTCMTYGGDAWTKPADATKPLITTGDELDNNPENRTRACERFLRTLTEKQRSPKAASDSTFIITATVMRNKAQEDLGRNIPVPVWLYLNQSLEKYRLGKENVSESIPWQDVQRAAKSFTATLTPLLPKENLLPSTPTHKEQLLDDEAHRNAPYLKQRIEATTVATMDRLEQKNLMPKQEFTAILDKLREEHLTAPSEVVKQFFEDRLLHQRDEMIERTSDFKTRVSVMDTFLDEHPLPPPSRPTGTRPQATTTLTKEEVQATVQAYQKQFPDRFATEEDLRIAEALISGTPLATPEEIAPQPDHDVVEAYHAAMMEQALSTYWDIKAGVGKKVPAPDSEAWKKPLAHLAIPEKKAGDADQWRKDVATKAAWLENIANTHHEMATMSPKERGATLKATIEERAKDTLHYLQRHCDALNSTHQEQVATRHTHVAKAAQQGTYERT